MGGDEPGRTPRCAATTVPGPSQPGEQVEEVHAVLDEDAAALGSVPEPVFARQVFIRGVVLKVSVQEIAQDLGLDQVFDCVVDRVVPLHQVDRQQQASFAGDRDHGVGLLERHRQRFLADDVLAGFERREGLRSSEETAESRYRPGRRRLAPAAYRRPGCPEYRNAPPRHGPPARFVPAMPISLTPGTCVNCWRA